MSVRLAPSASTLPSQPRASARVGTVAAQLDCDQSQIRRLVREGQLESFTIGKRGVRIYLDSVAAYQERQARPEGGKTPGRRRSAGPDRRAATTAAHNAAEAELRRLGYL